MVATAALAVPDTPEIMPRPASLHNLLQVVVTAVLADQVAVSLVELARRVAVVTAVLAVLAAMVDPASRLAMNPAEQTADMLEPVDLVDLEGPSVLLVARNRAMVATVATLASLEMVVLRQVAVMAATPATVPKVVLVEPVVRLTDPEQQADPAATGATQVPAGSLPMPVLRLSIVLVVTVAMAVTVLREVPGVPVALPRVVAQQVLLAQLVSIAMVQTAATVARQPADPAVQAAQAAQQLSATAEMVATAALVVMSPEAPAVQAVYQFSATVETAATAARQP